MKTSLIVILIFIILVLLALPVIFLTIMMKRIYNKFIELEKSVKQIVDDMKKTSHNN